MLLKRNTNKANLLAYAFSLFVVVICSSLSIVIYLNSVGVLVPIWYTAELNNINRIEGLAFCAIPEYDIDRGLSSKLPFKIGNSIGSVGVNKNQVQAIPYITVYENNVALNESTITNLNDVAINGKGRVSLSPDSICFSSSDNTSPLSNMRTYTLAYPLIVSGNLVNLLYSITCVLWLILTGFIYYKRYRMVFFYKEAVFLVIRYVNTLGKKLSVKFFLFTSVITLISFFLAALVYLNQKFLFTPLWLHKPINVIRHDQGYSFKGYTGIFEISSIKNRSTAVVLENGTPLSSKNSLHAEIREIGCGRYSFWEDIVYFSTIDNSNPLTNSRRYEIYYPYVVPTVICLCIYVVFALFFSFSIGYYFICYQKLVGYFDNKIRKTHRSFVLILSMSLTALSLLAYAGFPLFYQFGPSLHQNIIQLSTDDSYLRHSTGFFIITLFSLLLSYAIKLLILKNKIPTWYKAFCFVIVSIFLVIYVVGPMRRIGEIVLSWDVYYMTPDSDSYVGRYNEYSLRPPLLPILTETLTDIDTVKKEKYPAGKPITTGQLIRVVRLQKILFVLSALCLAFTLMSIVDPLTVIVFYLLLFNVNAFNLEYSSLIMSESITQSLLTFLLSVFLYFAKKLDSSVLLLAGPLFSMMFLTRPAAIYAGVLVLIIAFCSLKLGLRHCWRNVIVSFLLMAVLIGAPMLHRYLKTGYLTPAGMYASSKITFALYFSSANDIDIMPSYEKKLFLKTAIELKEKQDILLRQYYKSEKELTDATIVSVLYSIKKLGVVAIAPQSAIIALPTGSDIERVKLIQEVSHILLKKHWYEYAIFIIRQYFYAVKVTLNAYPVVLVFWICFVAVALICKKNKLLLAYIAVGLAHFVHLFIVVSSDLPIIRYIKATEFLLFISLFLLVHDVVSKYISDFFKIDTPLECINNIETRSLKT